MVNKWDCTVVDCSGAWNKAATSQQLDPLSSHQSLIKCISEGPVCPSFTNEVGVHLHRANETKTAPLTSSQTSLKKSAVKWNIFLGYIKAGGGNVQIREQ